MNIRQKLENLEKTIEEAQITIAEILAYMNCKNDCKIIDLEVLKQLQIDREKAKALKEIEMRKKKRYGNGSITKRTRKNANGTTYTWYQANYSINGIRYTITAPTAPEAEKMKNAALKNSKTTQDKNKNITLNEWLNEWYKIYKEPFISESTKESYQICINKHISKNLKQHKLNSLTTLEIMTELNKIKVQRQKEITAQILTAAMRQAYTEGLTKIIAYQGIKIKKMKAKEKNILSRTDEPKLLELLPNFAKDAVIGYLNTGCRLRELLNINEKDIDRINKLIKIRGTKTNSSIRIIPLLPQVENILPLKNQKSAECLQRIFKETADKLNLKITIHDLRHTFATRCLEKGVNMKTIQIWLGHSSYNVTADIYSHITANFEHNEVEKLLE